MDKNILNNIEEMIKRANRSTNNDEIKELSKSMFVSVRRAIAKNRNTSSEIINELAYDSTANVSVIASKHHRCTIKREFDSYTLNHKCVTCKKSEEEALYECKDCLA
jgi:hypothetical protein